jgi:hypothetical protein
VFDNTGLFQNIYEIPLKETENEIYSKQNQSFCISIFTNDVGNRLTDFNWQSFYFLFFLFQLGIYG